MLIGFELDKMSQFQFERNRRSDLYVPFGCSIESHKAITIYIELNFQPLFFKERIKRKDCFKFVKILKEYFLEFFNTARECTLSM